MRKIMHEFLNLTFDQDQRIARQGGRGDRSGVGEAGKNRLARTVDDPSGVTGTTAKQFRDLARELFCFLLRNYIAIANDQPDMRGVFFCIAASLHGIQRD